MNKSGSLLATLAVITLIGVLLSVFGDSIIHWGVIILAGVTLVRCAAAMK